MTVSQWWQAVVQQNSTELLLLLTNSVKCALKWLYVCVCWRKHAAWWESYCRCWKLFCLYSSGAEDVVLLKQTGSDAGINAASASSSFCCRQWTVRQAEFEKETVSIGRVRFVLGIIVQIIV